MGATGGMDFAVLLHEHRRSLQAMAGISLPKAYLVFVDKLSDAADQSIRCRGVQPCGGLIKEIQPLRPNQDLPWQPIQNITRLLPQCAEICDTGQQHSLDSRL